MSENNTILIGRKPHHGRLLKRLRMGNLMKQEVLADKLGVHKNTVIDMEKREVFEDELIQKVCEIFDVDVEDFKNATDDCPLTININGENSSNDINNTHIENDLKEPLDRIEKLYREINDLNIQVHELKRQLTEQTKKK